MFINGSAQCRHKARIAVLLAAVFL